MATPLARTHDHHDHRHRTVDQEAPATVEAARTLLEREGGRPMVRRKIATDAGKTVEAPVGTTTVEVTETMARNGAEDFRHHNDETNLSTGRSLIRIGSVRGKKSRHPSA